MLVKIAVIASFVVGLVLGFVYYGLILVPGLEFLGVETLGCNIRPCGINPDCETMSETLFPEYFDSPYDYVPATIPPTDIDDSVDNERKKGLCECNYPDTSTPSGYSPTPRCHSERAYNYTYRTWAPALADEDDEKYGFTGGFCSTLLCPSIGVLYPTNCTLGTTGCHYNGELLHWTRPQVQLYIYGPVSYLFGSMVLFVGLVFGLMKFFAYRSTAKSSSEKNK